MATKSDEKPADDPTQGDSLTREPTVREQAEAASFVARNAANYSKYRAAVPLRLHGVVAFPADAAVPADHPSLPRWLEDGLVVGVEG